jgi:ethylmalonyl-CoA/methylmalonyl-CoA decarboxylase
MVSVSLNDTINNILTNQLGYEMSRFMGQNLQRFSQLPMISVALVEGTAVGGGAELAMSCDFMVMSDKARFGFVQSKMGLITGWGAGTRLVRKFGSSKALLDCTVQTKMLSSLKGYHSVEIFH